MTDPLSRYRQAARRHFYGGRDDVLILEDAPVRVDSGRGGAWVGVQIFVPSESVDSEPGPTYEVWIAERTALHPTVGPGGYFVDGWHWPWIHDSSYTCEDDADGRSARAAAHEYARHLRKTYPCAFVAVRPAGKPPLPIHPSCE
jgi:hypothetical protein